MNDPDAQRPASAIQRLPFDDRAVQAIGALFGVAAAPAPFGLPGGTVYQVLVEGANGRPSVMLTLWPSIRRVDAISLAAAAVATRVVSVDLVPGVEVLFRRESGEYLIVSTGGKIIVRA